MRRRHLLVLLAVPTLAALSTQIASLGAQATVGTSTSGADRSDADGIRTVGPDYNMGRPLPFADDVAEQALVAAGRVSAAKLERGVVGDVRAWPAIDDSLGEMYLKDYTLRGSGAHSEVWAASLEFPEGDCRNGERTIVTDAQVAYLIDEIESNIYPKESEVFSVPPARDGSIAALPGLVGLPPDYYQGAGEKIVVLVDNVRDASYWDTNNSQGLPYIAGFFFSVFNELVDRNVMVLDGYDWLHRLGANPPDEPVPGDLCASKPARPFLYEATLAHEYQHLLLSYVDPDETISINEGLSDWAQTLTGYVDPARPITDTRFDDHTQCFLGHLGVATPANPNPDPSGGPENSLTLWGDQGGGEILCDYGAAYTLMEFLAGRFGTGFMSALHSGEANGFAGLAAALESLGSSESVAGIVHDWAAMVALDGVLDDGAKLFGGKKSDFTTPTLDASIRWASEQSFSTPGAPPNGSDYVRLRDADGDYLSARQLRSVTFDGADTLPATPVEWSADPEPPLLADPGLASGSGPSLDRAIVAEVSVPAEDPTLTFETLFDTELGFDYGFVQVSEDGGKTYRSLGNADTTEAADPGALPAVHDNLPGLTGVSGGGEQAVWTMTTFDLSAHAGKTILLSFRYLTDSAVDGPGWWIDDVEVGGEPLTDGSSLEGWRTPTEILPTPVAGFTLQLVGYKTGTKPRAAVRVAHLDEGFRATLNRRQLERFRRAEADVVAAIVTYDDPAEAAAQYAPYSLTANGVLQPGG